MRSSAALRAVPVKRCVLWVVAGETAVVLQNEINGNGNTINQDIVIQAPKGDGTGMQGSAGTVTGTVE